jgi:type I restriction enzyme S subunit
MKRKRDNEEISLASPLDGKLSKTKNRVAAVTLSEIDTVVKAGTTVTTWAIPLQRIYENSDKRLDASHYDRETEDALQELENCGFSLQLLSEMADINLPGQFVRIWAKEKAYGIPYVNATDLMSLSAVGALSGKTRYLSRETDTDINALVIHEGWLLLSCSGTIGRVFYVPKRMDGWVATHDLIRIIPKKKVPVGFLHTYLSSPVAQRQIIGYTHGGQIDHVTDKQIANILVPVLPDETIVDLHSRTMHALNMREQAVELLTGIADDIKRVIKK